MKSSTTDHQTIVVQSPLQPSCMFCLTTIEPEEPLLTKDGCPCTIVFHTHCIQTWLQMYEDHPCPLCRKPVTFISLPPPRLNTQNISIVLIILLIIVLLISYYLNFK